MGTEEHPDEQDTVDAPQPDWWHRDHPTFTSIAGFFTGLVYVVVVPGLFAAVLGLFVDGETVQRLFPLVLVALLVPLGLLAAHRTRRFGRYMLIGILATALVVLASAGLTLWVLWAMDS